MGLRARIDRYYNGDPDEPLLNRTPVSPAPPLSPPPSRAQRQAWWVYTAIEILVWLALVAAWFIWGWWAAIIATPIALVVTLLGAAVALRVAHEPVVATIREAYRSSLNGWRTSLRAKRRP